MLKPNVPTSILQNLRCGHCRRFVTCGPVFVTPDGIILCGRCQNFAKNIYRNEAFEVVASLYRYPCHYWPQHCDEALEWNESLHHEYTCPYNSQCNVFCCKPGTFCKSVRKFPNTTEIRNYAHVTEDMLQILQCVQCYSYLSNAPVCLLPNGKNICHRCIHSNGAPNGGVRNLAYETIASSVVFPCVYVNRGCQARHLFGRDSWAHEAECSSSIINENKARKPSHVGKDGKTRGVIATHSGHIYGTITPLHFAPYAPPTQDKDYGGEIFSIELNQKFKKNKNETNFQPKARLYESPNTNNSRSTPEYLFRGPSPSYKTESRDDHSHYGSVNTDQIRPSSYAQERANTPPQYHAPSDISDGKYSSEEVAPSPKPAGFNRSAFNGYYNDQALYGDPYRNSEPYDRSSKDFPSDYARSHIQPKRIESFRVGNPQIINELKIRNNNKIREPTSVQEQRSEGDE